jgi:carbamoyl-phosphate synthase small subunit
MSPLTTIATHAQLDSPAWLVLEDGRVWQGRSVGASGRCVMGELVFNTAMTGYQEILTDPSYSGQVVMMTYPEIGNYGINADDLESERIHVAGLVVRRLSPSISNWRSSGSLPHWLWNAGVVAMEGIDTRAVTRHVREAGAMKCLITTLPEDIADMPALLERLKQSPSLEEQNWVAKVTTPKAYTLPGTGALTGKAPLINRLAVIDFGTKLNILRCLQSFVGELVVLPADSSFETVMATQPDMVFLSNGPGDPRTLPGPIALAQQLMIHRIPTFGICLGHQILALALGLRVEKMRFGHHGGNHPVRDEELGQIIITSQNHGYCVVLDEGPAAQAVTLTHVNLNDGSVEGFRHTSLPVASVQFHPEAAPGPQDALYLFDRFLSRLSESLAPIPQPSKVLSAV